MPHRYSIDFGTTNSVVARWNGGKRETVSLPGLSIRVGEHFLVPSLLYVRDGRAGDVLIGAAVRDGGFDCRPDNRLFRNFKRGIGAAASALEPRLIDGAPWTDAEAGEHFLRCLLAALPCPPADIEQLVLTVPVAAFEGYSAWLSSALTGFPPERIRILDESTAAALGYAVSEPGAHVLISDFGGGTLDLSLVRLPESGPQPGSSLDRLPGANRAAAAQVIAKTGVALGGSDIDRWLLADVLERTHISSRALGLAHAGLLSVCESAKITLSTAEQAEIGFQPQTGHAQALTLTRLELEALLDQRGFYATLRQALDRLMGQAHQRGVFKEDIGHVLLVGGTSLIPSVQRAFDSYFRAVTHGRRKISLPTWPALHWTVENTTIRVDRPFTAVVEGALQVAAGLGLDDRLTHSYGLRVFDADTGQTRYEEIIPAGSTYPSAPVTVKLAAAVSGQVAVDLVVAQIDTGDGSPLELRDEAGQAIIIPLNAGRPVRVPLRPPGVTGRARLSATFHVDASRQLRLTVTDLKTRGKLVEDAFFLLPSSAPAGEEPAADQPDNAAPFPPALAPGASGTGYRLSLRNLASALNLLPAAQLSSEVLAAALRSGDTLVRYNAAEMLCRRGDREARLILKDVLAHGTPPQRASAVQHLYRFSWFGAESLFRQALGDQDCRVRESALFALCKMHAPEAYRLALEILHSPDATDGMRRSAVWGATDHPDAGAVPLLEQAIRASDPQTREAALEVLGASGSADAIPIAVHALDDPDADIQYAATLSWVELAGESCFAGLAERLETMRGEARGAILRGFFHATNYTGLDVALSPHAERLISALQAAVGDDLSQTRIAAARPLAWIRRPSAEQALRLAFGHETDADVKAHMLRIAVNLSSPVAAELLAAALQDPDVLVRQTAEYLQPHS